jgi:hypothetical protein
MNETNMPWEDELNVLRNFKTQNSLNNIKLKVKIGEGGNGEVYAIINEKGQRYSALKCLKMDSDS